MTRKTPAAKAKNVAYTREWDKANPSKRREIAARHRAKAKAAKGVCPYPWCREMRGQCPKHGYDLALTIGRATNVPMSLIDGRPWVATESEQPEGGD